MSTNYIFHLENTCQASTMYKVVSYLFPVQLLRQKLTQLNVMNALKSVVSSVIDVRAKKEVIRRMKCPKGNEFLQAVE